MPNVSSVKSKTFGDVAAADTASLAALQTLGGAGDMTLKAAAGTGAYNGTNLAQLVDITCGADVASVTFSVTGTDVNGDAQTETLTGPDTTTVSSANKYATVTSIVASGSITTQIQAGILGTGALTGIVFAGRTRIRGITGTSKAVAGSIVFKNTSITGTSLLTIPLTGAVDSIDPYIPDNGVLFDAGAYVNLTAASVTGVTVYYDG